jgi:hypothetical protein
VLGLLTQPVAIRLGVGLREEWTNILANVLGQVGLTNGIVLFGGKLASLVGCSKSLP